MTKEQTQGVTTHMTRDMTGVAKKDGGETHDERLTKVMTRDVARVATRDVTNDVTKGVTREVTRDVIIET